MKQMKTVLSAVLASSISVALADLPSNVFYQNDFSTRATKNAELGAPMMEQRVYTGRLAVNYNDDGAFKLQDLQKWNGDCSQADWFMPWYNTSAARPAFFVGPQIDGEEVDGNPFVYHIFGAGVDNRLAGEAIANLHNEFTEGVLRITFDARRPSYDVVNSYLRVIPVFRKKMENPAWGSASTKMFTAIGLQCVDAGGVQKAALMLTSTDGREGGADCNFDFSKVIVYDQWYRFVFDLDLTRGKVSGKVYQQGGHPAWGSANGSLFQTFAERTAYDTIANAGMGGIAGLSVKVSNQSTKPNGSGNPHVPDHSIRLDNLKVEWKAPDSEDFVSCYENDFSTRRYRTVCPASEATHVYGLSQAADSCITTNVFDGYWINQLGTDDSRNWLVPYTTGGDSSHDNDVQPLGQDGWRRLNNAGTATFSVVDGQGDGGNLLRCTRPDGNDSFGIVAHSLVEPITSGKVYARADIRTPSVWTHGGLNTAFIALGNGKLYSAKKSEVGANQATRCGLGATSGNDKSAFRPAWSDASGTLRDDVTVLKATTWYRCEIVIDLDNKASGNSVRIWEIGGSSKPYSFQPSSKVFERTGISLFNSESIDEISSLILGAYGPGVCGTNSGYIFFDNIAVFRDYGTPQERMVYRNLFNERDRYLASASRALVPTGFGVEGEDGFRRFNDGTGTVRLVNPENPCLAAWSANGHSIVVHPLMRGIESGNTMFSVDIRPPTVWSGTAAQQAEVFLGDDRFLQGSMFDNHDGKGTFFGSSLACFGFTKQADGLAGGYRGARIFAADGNGDSTQTPAYPAGSVAIQATHWYRFTANVDLDSETYSLRVHDMGDTQPSLSTPRGALVASMDNLGFRTGSVAGGVTSIGFGTYGNPSIGDMGANDPGVALYDNITIGHPFGTMVIIR